MGSDYFFLKSHLDILFTFHEVLWVVSCSPYQTINSNYESGFSQIVLKAFDDSSDVVANLFQNISTNFSQFD